MKKPSSDDRVYTTSRDKSSTIPEETDTNTLKNASIAPQPIPKFTPTSPIAFKNDAKYEQHESSTEPKEEHKQTNAVFMGQNRRPNQNTTLNDSTHPENSPENHTANIVSTGRTKEILSVGNRQHARRNTPTVNWMNSTKGPHNNDTTNSENVVQNDNNDSSSSDISKSNVMKSADTGAMSSVNNVDGPEEHNIASRNPIAPRKTRPRSVLLSQPESTARIASHPATTNDPRYDSALDDIVTIGTMVGQLCRDFEEFKVDFTNKITNNSTNNTSSPDRQGYLSAVAKAIAILGQKQDSILQKMSEMDGRMKSMEDQFNDVFEDLERLSNNQSVILDSINGIQNMAGQNTMILSALVKSLTIPTGNHPRATAKVAARSKNFVAMDSTI